MRNTHAIVGSTLAATVIALAGCDAQMFANVNQSLTQFKTASKSTGSPVVPAASIAATMGGVALAQSMANKSASLIAAGGGNLIAAGAGNYMLQQAKKREQGLEKLQNANGVSEANYEWESEWQDDKTVTTTIKNFSCKSQGYNVTAKGTFVYTAGASTKENAYIVFQTGGKLGSFTADLTGDVKYDGKAVVKISMLKLNAENPLPENGSLGEFKMESTATGDDYVLIEAKASIVKNVITAEGTSKVGKADPKPIKFDQSNQSGISDAAEGK